MRLPWISAVSLAHGMISPSGWHDGNWEINSTPWTLELLTLGHFLQCGRVHYQEMLLLWRLYGVFSYAYVGGRCQRTVNMNARIKGFPAERCSEHHSAFLITIFLQPVAVYSPGERCAHIQPSTWQKRMRNSPEQATFFQCSHVHCRCLW